MPRWVRVALFAGLTTGMMACAENDEITGEAAHAPVTARLYTNGEELTPSLSMARAETIRIEVRFFGANGERITGIEPDHFVKLTFSPASLASSADVPDLRFFKYVISQASVGSRGTVMVGYGHRATADEGSFGPFSVTIR